MSLLSGSNFYLTSILDDRYSSAPPQVRLSFLSPTITYRILMPMSYRLTPLHEASFARALISLSITKEQI